MNKPISLPSEQMSDLAPGAMAGRSPVFEERGSRGSRSARDMVPTVGVYAKQILAHKWMVLFLTILSGAIAAFVVTKMTPIYEANAKLVLEDTKRSIVSIEELYGSAAPASREHQQTQTEFIQSREVLTRVMTQLDLVNDPSFDPRIPQPNPVFEWLREYEWARPYIREPEAPELTQDDVDEIVLRRLQGGLRVSPIRLTQLINIGFQHPDPEKAALIANTIGNAYVEADLQARFEIQEQASRWLAERLDKLRTNLEASERKLQDFREEIGVVDTGGSKGGTINQLSTTSERLVQARLERAAAEQLYRQVRPGQANRYEVAEVFNNPAVAAARVAETQARLKLDELSTNLGIGHPAYRSAQAEYEAARENVVRQSEAVISSITKRLEAARSAERSLLRDLEASRTDIQEYTRKEGQLTVLEREVATNQQIYQTFLARVKETDAIADLHTPVARPLDSAVPPRAPVKPNKPLIVLLALMVGGVLASMLAIVREQGSAVLRSTDDVEDKLEEPLLTAVPKVKGDARKIAAMQTEKSDSIFAESVRTAMMSVKLATMETRCPVIAFTSSVAGEGKSTLALSLAIEQARSQRTLLIDADLRRPTVATRLGLSADKPGLSEILMGNVTIDAVGQAIQLDIRTKLSVITAGKPVRNPLDWLMTDTFGQLIASVRNDYDVVVIDTPPLELVADALAVGRESTGMVFVAKSGATPIPLIRRALARLRAARVMPLGIMLNAHDFSRASRYYGEYSGYSSYGYGYYGYSKK